MGQQPGAANSQAFARQTKVKKGSRVRLVVERGRMIVTPVTTGKITLKSLLAKVTPENIHPETDWGKPVGKEIWPQEPGLAGAPCRILGKLDEATLTAVLLRAGSLLQRQKD